MTETHLALTPRDGFFVKDGRGWYTHAAARAHGWAWPPPQTVLGALRGGYGRWLETQRNRPLARSEWPTETRDVALGASVALRFPPGQAPSADHRMWPSPADALYLKDHDPVLPLEPQAPNLPTMGWDDTEDAARERLWRPRLDDLAKPEPMPQWWTEADFVAWLLRQPVRKRDRENWPDPIRRLDVHVSIARDTLTAIDGALFAHDVIETLGRNKDEAWQWSLACRVELPQPAPLAGDLLTLGGKRMLADCSAADPSLFAPSAGLVSQLGDDVVGLRLVTVTPTLFMAGWLPDGLAPQGEEYIGEIDGLAALGEVVLRAAYVPRPTHVSGWDMHAGGKGQPKPTLRLVPPGAVYFIERRDGQPFAREQVEAAWLAAWGSRSESGYGRLVAGVWKRSSS